MGLHNDQINFVIQRWRKLRIPNIARTEPYNYIMSAIQKNQCLRLLIGKKQEV